MTIHNGLALTPPMGWNSYDCYGGEVTEAEVRANAEYMAKHLRQHGWEYVVIDIGWHVRARAASFDAKGVSRAGDAREVDAYGRLLPAPDRFPSAANGQGFKPLADFIHGLGLKFGIHIMPGIPAPAVQEKRPVSGTAHTAADVARHDAWNKLSPGFLHLVDYAKPGAQAYMDSLIAQYAAWGVDLIKMDGIGLPYLPDVTEAAHAARCGAGARWSSARRRGITIMSTASAIAASMSR